MKIDLTEFLHAVSAASDYVENEVLDVPKYHVKRVAVLTNKMAIYLGMDGETVFALTQAAVLHDCALSEYLNDELKDSGYNTNELDMTAHCIAGEKMLLKLPFYHKVEGAILYHHDRADGKGALGKSAGETPIHAQLIHIADKADVIFGLYTMDPEKYSALMVWINEQKGIMFSEECCRAFTAVVDYDLLCSISGDKCIDTLEALLPDVCINIPIDLLREMSTIFADITDYKSHFTCRHSLGIAEKAEHMGQYYGYSKEMCNKLYIAGALHDIGKLLISNDILEKPDKLTPDEYKEITNHAIGTWELLHNIKGMEDITRWASLHHEKLDGSGYPFGYTAKDLGKHERLLACLDIYQALVEERPYRHGMPHREAMAILRKMGDAGQLDTQIITDIDDCYAHQHTDTADQSGAAAESRIYVKEAWRCPVCGYVYEGELPKDLICPQCKQPGSIFEKI